MRTPPQEDAWVVDRLKDLQWLNSRVASTLPVGDGRIRGVEVGSLNACQGIFGTLLRVVLRTDSDRRLALVAKTVHSQVADAPLRQRLFRNELYFYREVAAHLPIRCPRLVLGEYDEEEGRGILVIEDVAPAVCGDMRAGTSLESARLVLGEIALLHASFMNRRLPGRVPDAMHLDPYWQNGSAVTVAGAWVAFRKTFSQLPETVLRLGEWLAEAGGVPTEDVPALRGLNHGDLSLGNVAFHGDERPTFIDWQHSHLAHPMDDVAFFLSKNLERSSDLSRVPELVDWYRSQLSRHAGFAYSSDGAWRDFQIGMARSFLATVYILWTFGVIPDDTAPPLPLIAARVVDATAAADPLPALKAI